MFHIAHILSATNLCHFKCADNPDIPKWQTLTLMSPCREFLLACAAKVGVEGAAEFLEDPNNGVKEV